MQSLFVSAGKYFTENEKSVPKKGNWLCKKVFVVTKLILGQCVQLVPTILLLRLQSHSSNAVINAAAPLT